MESKITRLEIYTSVKTYSYRVFQKSCEDVPQSVPSNRGTFRSFFSYQPNERPILSRNNI